MHSQSRKLTIIAAALAAASLAACERTAEPPGTATDPPSNTAPSVGAQIDSAVDRTKEVIDDAAITAKVKGKLIADDQLKGTQIDVDTSNGAVTLRGSVASAVEKDRATNVAREVDGVSGVDNQLSVRSGSS